MPQEEPKKQLREDPYPFAATDGFGIIESGAVEPKLSRASSQKSKTTMEKPTAPGKSGTIKAMGKVKVSEVSSLLGRAGTVGLGKAVNMLDIVGSSMTNLNSGSGFGSGIISKGNKISILAFEVANTIVKGSNLMQSLSRKPIKHLKEVVLPSEGVQCLVSKDMVELLRIAAADKRLESDLTPQQKLKETASEEMEYLMTLVHYTAVSYDEACGHCPFLAFENSSHLWKRWYIFPIFTCLLGVSRSISVPPNNRDALYQGLPPSIKSALRSKLQSFQVKEDVCSP
ncbi:hypothetical protein BHM03_00016985 [Ensete ventricosum]|nr:hypothetical protein BHM03_00016985 [Ensete ventricosum]